MGIEIKTSVLLCPKLHMPPEKMRSKMEKNNLKKCPSDLTIYVSFSSIALGFKFGVSPAVPKGKYAGAETLLIQRQKVSWKLC